MSALTELNNEGSVDRADNWTTLKTEVLDKLEKNGTSGSSRDELIKPLDEAVGSGSEFKSLVIEMTREYEADRQGQTAAPQQQATSADEEKEIAAFTAQLPNIEELATQIATDLATDIQALIAQDPGLAEVSDEELIKWITEDVTAAIDEIGEHGWEQLG
jgi:hypothetical protein